MVCNDVSRNSIAVLTYLHVCSSHSQNESAEGCKPKPKDPTEGFGALAMLVCTRLDSLLVME